MSNPSRKFRDQELEEQSPRNKKVEQLVLPEDFEPDSEEDEEEDSEEEEEAPEGYLDIEPSPQVTDFLTLLGSKPPTLEKTVPKKKKKKRILVKKIVVKKKKKKTGAKKKKPVEKTVEQEDDNNFFEPLTEGQLRKQDLLDDSEVDKRIASEFHSTAIELEEDPVPLTEEELERKKTEVSLKTRYEYYRNVSDLLLADFKKNKLPLVDLIKRIEDQQAVADKAIELKTPDYRAAERALLDIPLFGDHAIEKQAKDLVIQIDEKATKQAGPAMQIYQLLTGSLAQQPLSIQARNVFQDRLDSAVAVLKQPSDVSGENDKVVSALVEIDKEMKEAVEKANVLKKEYLELAGSEDNAFLEKVEQGAPGVWKEYDKNAAVRLRAKQSDAIEAAELHDYKTAILLLQEFQTESEALFDEFEFALISINDDRSEAVERFKNLPKWAYFGLTSDLEQTAATPGLPEKTKLELKRLIALQKPGDEAKKSKDEPDPVKCVAFMDAYDEATDTLVALANVKIFLNDTMPVLTQFVEQALSDLHNHIVTLTQRIGDSSAKLIKAFQGRQADIVKRWEWVKSNAVDEVTLDADKYHGEAVLVRDEIARLLENPGPLRDQAALEKAQDALTAELHKAAELAGMLAGYSVDKGLAMEKQIAAAQKVLDTSKDRTIVDGARQVLCEAMNLYNIDQIVKQLDQVSVQINVFLDSVSEKLLELKSKVDKAEGEKRQTYEGLLKSLLNERDSLAALATSRSQSILDDALADAAKLVTAVNDALDGFAGKRNVPTVDSELVELNKVAKRLTDSKRSKVWQEYTYATYSVLETRIADARSMKGSKGLAALQKERLAIDEAITAMDLKATNAEKRFAPTGEIQTAADKVRAILTGTAFADAPDYKKAVETELDGIITSAKYEGRYAAGIKNVQALEERLKKEVAGKMVPEKDRAEKVAKQNRELEAEKFKVEVDNLTVELNRVIKKIPKKEIEWAWKRLREARKLAEKSKEYATGLETIESIRDRIALLVENPVGLAIAGRNKLAEVDKEFKAAKVQFDTLLTKLAEQMDKIGIDGKDLPATKKSVKTQLDAVGTLLNYDAFTASIAVLEDKKKDEKERAAVRERALRVARQMMTVIETDYRMRELSRAPMLPEMSGAVSRLQLALLNIENNMLVSL